MRDLFEQGSEGEAPTLAQLPLALGARCWIAVASAEHVARGCREGFMQVCHGKGGPLRRMRPGDGVAYCSPTRLFRGSGKLQAFTALGRLREREPYQVTQAEGFHPRRRDVAWSAARVAAIAPLLEQFAFTRGQKAWGYRFRVGLFEVSRADFSCIAGVMGVQA
ncbi:EVE domain-containing protein [Sagittula sp. S175]|uniref:EVE domain-containing protein n=1 Tax=Sagittula sp. S175 TaxID=3415129 RepID=UPI003C7ABA0A